MHLKRWITSLIILPPLIGLIYIGGGLLFGAFILAVTLICLGEYWRIVLKAPAIAMGAVRWLRYLSYAVAVLLIAAATRTSFDGIIGILAFNLIAAALVVITQFKNTALISETLCKQVLGIIYIPLPLAYMVLIRNSIDGMLWVFFALVLIFAGDIGAYYVGSYWGRHKLCPAVSPKKTIEGALGGLAANVGLGAIFKYVFFPQLPWGLSIVFFIVVGALGQAGDLFESHLKRIADIKDSGAILPGHGGGLDRIDALLFAAPAVYYFKEYLLA